MFGLLILVIGISAVGWNAGRSAEPPPIEPTPLQESDIQVDEDIRNAVLEEISGSLSYAVSEDGIEIELDNIQLSADGLHAAGWIVRSDTETGDVMPSEPGIFIAERTGDGWVINLPPDTRWKEEIRAAPSEIIPSHEKNRLLGTNISLRGVTGVTADDGYLLPWAEGVPVNLSRSVSHDEDIPSGNAHYSFDFYIPKTMFNLYASKAGTVWAFKDSVPNNDHSDVNFIVLRNADNPDLYQLYLHLAQNSIPPSLKFIGAQVIQGQFVGVADNTGASTGHHLHFQVQNQPYWPVDNPYWGKSVDITFDEVNIYGGRPRRSFEYDPEICGGYCGDGLLTYISANTLKGDLTPPIGDFVGVTMGQIVDSSNLYLSGWASDADSGLFSGQLRALYNGNWHNLGDPFNSTFSYTWDLCSQSDPVPKGVVSVGLRLYDWDGNWADYAGLRHFIKNYECSQQELICTPNADQIALYEDADYSGGCVIIGPGNYPNPQSLGNLGDDDAASILVGANAQGTLYSDDSYGGHSETFVANDNNLFDNLIGIDTLSSLKVGQKSGDSGAPVILGPSSGSVFYELDLIPLTWKNGNNSVEYQVQYQLNGGSSVNLEWQKQSFYHLGTLSPGIYTWKVRGRNAAGVAGNWSTADTFEVNPAPAIPPGMNAPYTDDMENSQGDWTSSGLWGLRDDSEMSHSGTHAWWYQESDGDYDDNLPNSGSLSSPPINIPSSGYFLRFWYRYETESNKQLWDQRWVQVSVNGGPFINIYQLVDDPQISETNSWLQSVAFDLSMYAGQTVQFRFDFTTFDAELNAYKGWGIDDFTITSTQPATCGENRQDETPQDAFELNYSETIINPAEICPGGDYDYYKFNGQAGDQIVVDVDAQTEGSPLDSYLVLIDSDGYSVLAEHDDEVYAERRDPLMAYTLPHNGIYYIKVRAWKHPSAGGDDYEYTLRLYEDDQKPFTSILIPQSDTYIPVGPFDVTAQAVDAFEGISRIEFFWHDYDWIIPSWEQLGSDWDGTDGWSIQFDPTGLLERDGGAIYVNTYDKAGNWAGAGVWNIGVDLTPPSTNLLPLGATQESTALLLTWNGTDGASGIDRVNLQYFVDGEPWQTHQDDIFSSQYWFIGNPGQDYGFRIRGVDHAGNIENYPPNAETTTTIPQADVLCSMPDLYDSGDGDNSPELANIIDPQGGAQIHNFCNPLVPDRMADEDWIQFTVQSGKRYLIQAFPMNGNTAVVLELYDDDETTLLADGSSSTFGRMATIEWDSDRDGDVFLRMRHLDGRVIGNQVLYEVSVQQGYWMYFPLMNK
jgi:hypothetical protein